MLKKEPYFPDFIRKLPHTDIPAEGLTSYLLQGIDQQFVFMELDKAVAVPEHYHEAEWGVILEGELELTINGQTKTYQKGDTYFIPKDAPHSAKAKVGLKYLMLLNQVDRYKAVV